MTKMASKKFCIRTRVSFPIKGDILYNGQYSLDNINIFQLQFLDTMVKPKKKTQQQYVTSDHKQEKRNQGFRELYRKGY